MFSLFKPYPELVVGLSEKTDGNMKLSSRTSTTVLHNRRTYCERLGIDRHDVVSAEIVHGAYVAQVEESDKGFMAMEVDGLVTDFPGTYLTITAADCIPMYLFDPNKKVVAMVHAGWRSLASGIVQNAIKVFTRTYHSDPTQILVGLGPAIGQCHYEVGRDVIDIFLYVLPKISMRELAKPKEGRYYLDIRQIAQRQLVQQGVLRKHIEISSHCTFCESERYYSFRRDKPKRVQAMMAVIGMRKS